MSSPATNLLTRGAYDLQGVRVIEVDQQRLCAIIEARRLFGIVARFGDAARWCRVVAWPARCRSAP